MNEVQINKQELLSLSEFVRAHLGLGFANLTITQFGNCTEAILTDKEDTVIATNDITDYRAW